ncbi:MAG: hypothetical protein LJE67_13000 [Salaquimonas sp.]|nr:hypothetical protein [Salaquimonas sp.]
MLAGEQEAAACHHLFPALYFHTTKHWLGYLEGMPRPDIAYRVIEQFYLLYELHVCSAIEGGEEYAPAHWKPYFRLSRKAELLNLPQFKWKLLFLAARAHTRYDLAEAVGRAHDDYRTVYGESPDISGFRQLLLGPDTDLAFFQAAFDFCDEQMAGERSSRLDTFAVSKGARLFGRIWISGFQSWRHAAWNDAVQNMAGQAGNSGQA